MSGLVVVGLLVLAVAVSMTMVGKGGGIFFSYFWQSQIFPCTKQRQPVSLFFSQQLLLQ
jgi:hypothetical protein